MFKKDNKNSQFLSFGFLVKWLGFAVFSYLLVQIFYKREEWAADTTAPFDPFQIIISTPKTHLLSLLVWISLLLLSAVIINKVIHRILKVEARMRNIFESAVDGIITINDNGIIEEFNPAAQHMFGYSLDEVIGKNVSLLMPEPYNKDHNNFIKRYVRTGEAKVIGIGRETDGRRKDGVIFPIELSVSQVIIENHPFFTGMVHDITARKSIEAKLAKQYQRQSALAKFDLTINQSQELQKMLDQTVKVTVDLLPASRGACILLIDGKENKSFFCSSEMPDKKKSSMSKQILQHQEILQRIIHTNQSLVESDVSNSRSDLNSLLIQNQIQSYAGIPLCADKQVIGVLFAFDKDRRNYEKEDLDFLKALANRTSVAVSKFRLYEELQNANLSLENQKGELFALLDSTEEAIAFTSPNLQFISINQKFLDFFGIESIDTSSYQYQTFISQTDKIFTNSNEILSRFHESAIDSPKQYLDSFTQIWPVKRELELFSNPVRSSAGDYLGRLFVFRDVTYDREVDRMKSEFISTVSHELRTPLTSIHGSLGLINGGVVGKLSVKTRQLVEIAYKNSERLIRLINDILDIEKIRSDRMVFDNQPIDLIPLIKQAIRLNSAYGDQFGVKFQMIDSIDKGFVFADSARLMQVLTNLLSNAAKFSPNNGIVDISVTQKRNLIKVSVIDHGPGITKAFRKRIFQRFSQGDSSTTRNKGGTGLGLSINKAIVEKLNGKIGYETKIDQGTTFFFTLREWKEKKEKKATNND
jgi:PAS domain S-box-containing protein